MGIGAIMGGINWTVTIMLSIILGVLANLLTTPVQRFLAKHLQSQGRKRLKVLEAELRLVTKLVRSTKFLAWSFRRIMVLVSLFLVLTVFMYFSIDTFLGALGVEKLYEEVYFKWLYWPFSRENTLFILFLLRSTSDMVFLISCVIITDLLARTVRVIYAVYDFGKYKAWAEKQIEELSKRHSIEEGSAPTNDALR